MAKKQKFIPTIDQLIQDVTTIYIDESLNYDWCLQRLIWHLTGDDPDGKPNLTYDECIKKYRSHIENWNSRNAEREKKGYLGRPEANNRKNFVQFLEDRLYKIDWDSLSTSPIRDKYLFGDIKNDFLTEQRVAFMDLFKRGGNNGE